MMILRSRSIKRGATMHSLRNREKKNQRILYEEEIIMGSQNDKQKNEAMGVPKKRSARLRSAVQLEISYEVSAE